MRIQLLTTGISALLAVSSVSVSLAQQTVTDQYGTEILLDVLPPTTQMKVEETRSVLDSGGGEGPLKVDK
jgi:hypothetical protein